MNHIKTLKARKSSKAFLKFQIFKNRYKIALKIIFSSIEFFKVFLDFKNKILKKTSKIY